MRWEPDLTKIPVVYPLPPLDPLVPDGEGVPGAGTDTEDPTRARGATPEEYAERVALIRAKVEVMAGWHAAHQADLRAEVRTALLEAAKALLARIYLPQVDFKGKDADQVTYPIMTPEGVRAIVQSVAALLREYRNDIGEVGERTGVETTTRLTDIVRSDHERDLLRQVLDEAIALAEADEAAAPTQAAD